MMAMKSLGFVLFVLCIFTLPVEGAKILGLFPLASRSHMNVYRPVLRELALRGHELTVVSTDKPQIQAPNITEIEVPTIKTVFRKDDLSRIFVEADDNEFMKLWTVKEIFINVCQITVTSSEIHDLLNKGQSFDLVLVGAYANECAVQIAPMFAKHVVLIAASPVTIMLTFPYTSYPSFVPERSFPIPPRMNFFQRLQNAISTFIGRKVFEWIQSQGEKIVFSSIPNAPSTAEAQDKISLLLANIDLVLSVPQPYPPRIIPVGGMHLSKSKPLTKEFKKLVDGVGDEGFVIFTMGSITASETMPKKIRDAFVSALSRLKQKVIWKYAGEIENLPANIFLSPWLPQQDLLGHPKARLFITHGGLLGLQEAISFGVPVVGIPLYGDQTGNIALMKAYGLGEELNSLTTITAEKIYQTVSKVLNTKSYSENMKKYSAIFKDQLEPSVERAAFWVEYVLRHDGAHHLRSVGEDQGFIQYYLLDVIGLLSLVLIIVLWTLKRSMTLLCSYCNSRKTAATKKKN